MLSSLSIQVWSLGPTWREDHQKLSSDLHMCGIAHTCTETQAQVSRCLHTYRHAPLKKSHSLTDLGQARKHKHCVFPLLCGIWNWSQRKRTEQRLNLGEFEGSTGKDTEAWDRKHKNWHQTGKYFKITSKVSIDAAPSQHKEKYV